MKRILASVLALGAFSASTASAAPVYQLDAASISSSVTGFSLTFDDLDGDMLFSLNELLTFSGITSNISNRFFDVMTAGAFVNGIADGPLGTWSFAQSVGTGTLNIGAPNFTYTRTQQPSAVPLPATYLLVLAGLGGIAALRRRKRA